MAIPRFFKLPSAREFRYIPRYYDEAKEKREERIEKIKKEINADQSFNEESKPEGYVPDIKGKMRSHYQREARKSKRMSNIRILIIIAALTALIFYLLYS